MRGECEHFYIPPLCCRDSYFFLRWAAASRSARASAVSTKAHWPSLITRRLPAGAPRRRPISSGRRPPSLSPGSIAHSDIVLCLLPHQRFSQDGCIYPDIACHAFLVQHVVVHFLRWHDGPPLRKPPFHAQKPGQPLTTWCSCCTVPPC